MAEKSTGYQLGRALEYRARNLLEENGYWVIRAASSKGLVDLVAMKPGQTLFVQCKRSGSLAPVEWNALYALALRLGAVPLMGRRGARGTELLRLLAPKTGVRGQRQPMEPFTVDEPGEAR